MGAAFGSAMLAALVVIPGAAASSTVGSRPTSPLGPREGTVLPNEMLLFAYGTFTSTTGKKGAVTLSARIDRASGATTPATAYVSFLPAKANKNSYESHDLNFGSLARGDLTFDPDTHGATLATGSDLNPFGSIDVTSSSLSSSSRDCDVSGTSATYLGNVSGTFDVDTTGNRGTPFPELPKSKWGTINPVTWSSSQLYVNTDCVDNPPPPPTVYCDSGLFWDAMSNTKSLTVDWSGNKVGANTNINFFEIRKLVSPAMATADTFDSSAVVGSDLTFTPLSPGAQLGIDTVAGGTLPKAKYFTGQATDTQNTAATTSQFACQTFTGHPKTQTVDAYNSATLSNGSAALAVKDSFLGGKKVPAGGLPSTFSQESFA
jgi:hypothetical protein